MASTDAGVQGPTRARIEERTLRGDRWWLAPLVTFVVFTAFVVYATIRAFMGRDYYAAPYLSPFYSPCLGDCVEGASDFGQPFGWFPLSAALIILIFPLGFRMTCYYYRKAYYRAFWLSPPACAVAEPHTKYTGETRFPLILQNIHRYFLYLAFVPLFFLWIDAALTLVNTGGFRLGLGTIILFVNAGLLSGYSLSCHSLRHLAGGRLDCFSCTRNQRVQYTLWQRITRLNLHHMRWAWVSFFSVVLADLYVRMLALGVITDPAIHF